MALPIAAIGLLAGLWLTRRAARTDRVRAAWVLFGVWAAVHVVVFSGQEGIFHPYYVSALAPAITALAGTGAVTLWRWSARSLAGVIALDVALLATGVVALVLLRRADYASWLSIAVPVVTTVALVGVTWLRLDGERSRGRLAAVAVAGVLAALAAPAAYSVATTDHALAGGNLLGGPTQVSRGGFGGPAGPRGGPSTNTTLIKYLEAHQGSAKYLVAATGSQTTAPIIIATGKPVVTIGGFNGGDNAPTVAQLEQLVRSGQLRYVLLGGGGPGGGNQAIQAWVQQHGTVVTGSLYRVSA